MDMAKILCILKEHNKQFNDRVQIVMCTCIQNMTSSVTIVWYTELS